MSKMTGNERFTGVGCMWTPDKNGYYVIRGDFESDKGYHNIILCKKPTKLGAKRTFNRYSRYLGRTYDGLATAGLAKPL